MKIVTGAVLHQQALVTGRLLGRISGQAVDAEPEMTLHYKRAGQSEYRPCPVVAGMDSQGYFVFSTNQANLFAEVTPTPDFDFRLQISAPRYQSLSHEFSLTGTELTPVSETIDLLGKSYTVQQLPSPATTLSLRLDPEPLRLTGRVLQDGDPETPLAGAGVQITAPESRPPVTTDSEGYFAIDDVPLARQATLTLSHGGIDKTRDVVLDYNRPVVNRTFAF